MKTKRLLIAALALAVGMGAASVVLAGAGGADYKALAAKYDKLAAAQDKVVQEHETMKADTAKQNTGKPGLSVNAKMKKHCDAIIRDAKKLKKDYEAFAAWARMMAEEGTEK